MKLRITSGDFPTSYCSGCGIEKVSGVAIFGNLKGSGARGFLILCNPCKDELREALK